MLALLVAALDNTIIAPSLPKIISDLGDPNGDGITWVVVSYLLSSTAIAPSYGRFSDLFGRRKVFVSNLHFSFYNFQIFAVVIFLIGSAISGASTSIAMLASARGIQGLGGGCIMSLVWIIMGGNE